MVILQNPDATHTERLQSIDRLTKIIERRAKFLGLDAADKHEITVSEDVTPEAAARAVREAFGGAAAKPEGNSGG
jgi:hypothetical protein